MPFSLGLRDYLRLYRLARVRQNSLVQYHAFQQSQGQLLVEYLKSRGLRIRDTRALDLGCGLGGYSSALKESGARVTGVDLFPSLVVDNVPLVRSDALKLPFPDAQFNLVVCASLIEHVPLPRSLLQETLRVLDTDGTVYLSFPPFYSPLGGHQFAPFHLLGERIALRIARQRRLFRGRSWLEAKYPAQPASYDKAFGNWGLYPLTIAGIEKEIKSLPFRIVERSTRWLPFDFSGFPILREFLTWHVQFLLKKR